MRTQTHRRLSASRSGFTLIEMMLVVLVILILTGLTLAVVGRTMDGDRVRGASRQVQNYLAGARDRAIYAASRQEGSSSIPPAVGVRFFADPAYNISLPGGTRYRAFGSMVFVQEVAPLPTWLNIEIAKLDLDSDGVPETSVASQIGRPGANGAARPLDQLRNRSLRALIDRGLVGSQWERFNPITGADLAPQGIRVYYLPIYFDRDTSKEPYVVKFVDAAFDPNNPPAPASGSMSDSAGNPGTEWLYLGLLSKEPTFEASSAEPCRFRLLPAPMPSEEPRILPRGTVIDVESSKFSGSSLLKHRLRADGSFDIMFNAKGVVEGPLAAEGLVNLVVADSQDVERGFRLTRELPGPPPQAVAAGPYVDVFPPPSGDGVWDFNDANGNGTFDPPDEVRFERQREIFIVSVRTQTGSAMTSDLNPLDVDNNDIYDDPFKFAELGGEAK